LSCDTEVAVDGASHLVGLARAGLLATLPRTPAGATVSCRVTGSPPAAVVVLSGLSPELPGALAARFRETASEAEVAVDELDRELVVRLTTK
jgi:hypothetical protein